MTLDQLDDTAWAASISERYAHLDNPAAAEPTPAHPVAGSGAVPCPGLVPTSGPGAAPTLYPEGQAA